MRSNRQSGWRDREQGFLTLIGMLVVLVIIGILLAIEFGGPGGGGGGGKGGQTTLGGAVRRADDLYCRNNLSQLRSEITIYQGNNGTFPPSLEALQSQVPLSCPVGHEPYTYDATTGTVHCVHPGHGSY
jgi:type II secretory pathway pseudopilin PulG